MIIDDTLKARHPELSEREWRVLDAFSRPRTWHEVAAATGLDGSAVLIDVRALRQARLLRCISYDVFAQADMPVPARATPARVAPAVPPHAAPVRPSGPLTTPRSGGIGSILVFVLIALFLFGACFGGDDGGSPYAPTDQDYADMEQGTYDGPRNPAFEDGDREMCDALAAEMGGDAEFCYEQFGPYGD